MCFVFIWEQTATCATYSINWLVFITELKSVYSAVRTGSLNKAVCASSLEGQSPQYIHCLYSEMNSIKHYRTTSRVWRMNAEKTDVSGTLVVLVSRGEEEENRLCLTRCPLRYLAKWNKFWNFKSVWLFTHCYLILCHSATNVRQATLFSFARTKHESFLVTRFSQVEKSKPEVTHVSFLWIFMKKRNCRRSNQV
jgi:hypothetical protein